MIETDKKCLNCDSVKPLIAFNLCRRCYDQMPKRLTKRNAATKKWEKTLSGKAKRYASRKKYIKTEKGKKSRCKSQYRNYHGKTLKTRGSRFSAEVLFKGCIS